MSNKLDRPLEDIIKENKKKQPGQKGQKTFGKRGAPGKKFARPVIAKKGRTNDKRESRTNQKPRSQSTASNGRFIRRTKELGEATETPGTSKSALRISNLDFNITHKDLMDLFSQFGPIVRNKIDFDELGRSKGTAIIQYQKPESATKAIGEYDGATLDGKQLIVEYAKSSPKPKSEVPGIRKKIIRKPKDNREFSNRRRGGKNNNRFSRGGRQGGRKEGGRRADGRGNKSKAE